MCGLRSDKMHKGMTRATGDARNGLNCGLNGNVALKHAAAAKPASFDMRFSSFLQAIGRWWWLQTLKHNSPQML
jgi:hypothetical protein